MICYTLHRDVEEFRVKPYQSQPDALERRSHSRAGTHRPATVIAAKSSGFCQGRLVELGVGGFRVALPMFLPAGTDVELEFVSPARPGSPPARVRGRIAWIQRDEPAGWLCGGPFKVQFRTDSPGMPPLASAVEARALLGKMGSELCAVNAAELLPVLLGTSDLVLAEASGIPARVYHAGGAWRRIRRLAATLTLLAALLSLLLLIGAIARDVVQFPGWGSQVLAASTEDESSAPDLLAELSPVRNTAANTNSRQGATLPDGPPADPSQRPEHSTVAGRGGGGEAMLLAGEGGDFRPAPPGGALDGATFAPVDSLPPGAVTSFADLLTSAPMDAALVRENWATYDRALSQFMSAGGSERSTGELEELLVVPAAGVLKETAAPAVFVDTERYLLTVMRGDAVLAVFPVGLGAHQSTPEGTFEVANKIKSPKWYNRGRPIPAGDQRNPLGEYWIGLGDERGPTSYGIHPTKEADSIGAARSRGCIRMRPSDAALVFGWCRIGTPVIIGPLASPAPVAHS